MTTIIALDPSLAASGLAVWRSGQPLMLSTIRSSRWETYNGWSDPARFDRVAQAVTNFVEPGNTICTMEDMIKPSAEAARGTSTLDLARLRGVLETDLYRADVPINRVYPATLKAYALSGKVSKLDMVNAARTVLGTDYPVDNDNEADAFWLLAMTLQAYGFPVVKRTPRRITFCNKVQWSHFDMREATHA